jgi:hypothetical protein
MKKHRTSGWEAVKVVKTCHFNLTSKPSHTRVIKLRQNSLSELQPRGKTSPGWSRERARDVRREKFYESENVANYTPLCARSGACSADQRIPYLFMHSASGGERRVDEEEKLLRQMKRGDERPVSQVQSCCHMILDV